MHPKFLTNLYRIQNDRKSAIRLGFLDLVVLRLVDLA